MDGNTTVKYLQHYLRQKDLGFLALDSLPPGPQREAQEERLKHNLFWWKRWGRSPAPSFTASFGAQGSR